MIQLKINTGIFSIFMILLWQVPGSVLAQNNIASFSIHFSVDYQDSLQLYRDEPAVLTVSISNPASAFATAWNKEARSYLTELENKFKADELSEEAYQKEQKLVTDGMIKTTEGQIGSPSEPWASKVIFKVYTPDRREVASLSTQLLKSSKPVPVLVLTENAYASASYHLPPNALKAVTSGTYDFVASIGAIQSAPVQLQFQSKTMPDNIRNGISMLLKTGQYYLQDENPTKAIEYAERILNRNANSIDALVLRADSYLLLKNYNNALSDYKRALDLFYQEFPDAYELPEYLLDMIEYAGGKG